MADYSVSLARSARKELERLPDQIANKILDKLAELAANPRPVGVTKLHGQKNLWRLRAGDYRIVYSINDVSRIVDISIIRHRREVYRGL
jgi:mRNA interferase RelE/StbE